ncbi:hypothetical protein AA101099_1495 [Neoasaia chiangmaiensis NBRC 101099]|nr:hypothetical protein AA101099_1495 [Neoasaia chiangmaiensis NBRC 101099]GEN15587.1 hypothetical protein NCH01_20180 [Neoasaia chiangmaiensis]
MGRRHRTGPGVGRVEIPELGETDQFFPGVVNDAEVFRKSYNINQQYDDDWPWCRDYILFDALLT